MSMRSKREWEAYYQQHPDKRPVFRFEGVDYPTLGEPGAVYESFADWYNDAFCVLIVPEEPSEAEERIKVYRRYWKKVKRSHFLTKQLKQYKLDRIEEVAQMTREKFTVENES